MTQRLIRQSKSVTNWSELEGKPTTFASTWELVTGKPLTFASDWGTLANKPTTFASTWELVTGKPLTFASDWGTLANKPTTFASTWDLVAGKPTAFPSSWATVADKPTAFASAWDLVTGKPSTFPPFQESATWVPSISGTTMSGAHTYSERAGYWTRLNKLINLWFSMIISVKDNTMQGAIVIPIPFTAKNETNYWASGSVSVYSGFTFPAGYTQLKLHLQNNRKFLAVRFGGSNLPSVLASEANVGSSVTLRGSISYLID